MTNLVNAKKEKRLRRHRRIRTQVKGSVLRPRLAVFRSNRYLAAQLIDDEAGATLVGLSTRELSKKGTRTELALELGKKVAKAAEGKGVSKVVFDRGGYRYAGNIKAFADGARVGGLEF